MIKLKRTALRIFAHTLLPSAKRVFVVLVLSLLVSPLFFLTRGGTPVYAATSDTLNFQARLENAAGGIAPDGYYNIQFKLYDAASGGTNLWTESYTYNSGSGSCTGPLGGNDCRVRVVNGYISVNLGEATAFGSIPWDQQLYLTMNIGGTVTSGSFPTMGDGEMDPRLKLTAVPYAFQAKQAESLSQIQGSYTGTLSFDTLTGAAGTQNFVIPDQGAPGTYDLLTGAAAAGSFVQLQAATPTTQQAGGAWISGTSRASTFQGSYLDTASSGVLTIGATN
ncbi:hypothetical protein KDA14_03615, partial [Candidatus Saccharibacteria bacterium]|nr:hypothetical protein [Candidatus Saccharibacteria bacterium]